MNLLNKILLLNVAIKMIEVNLYRLYNQPINQNKNKGRAYLIKMTQILICLRKLEIDLKIL